MLDIHRYDNTLLVLTCRFNKIYLIKFKEKENEK